MNIQTQIFATLEQVRQYIDRNHGSFVVTTDFTESNYYILETPESSIVILINKINQFYYVFTRVLMKQSGSTQFIPITEASTVTQNKTVFLANVLACQIKHIGSDTDIKNESRAIEEAQRVQAQARVQETPRAAGGGGGHMLDYIGYIQDHALSTNIRRQVQPGLATAPVSHVQTEEIKEDQNYKINITCPICLGNKVNMVCIPCGHCICSACQEQNPKKNACAICRNPVKSTHVFFI
jgi:hypothetical protein